MTKQEFIDHVLDVLNEAESDFNPDQFIGADMAQVPNYVEKLYPAAWRRAANLSEKGLLPKTWFETISFKGNSHVVDAENGTGYVVLPDDFLVLSSFKMRGWKTACHTAVEENDPIGRKQSNEYVRGTPQRPVCVYNHETVQVRDGDIFTEELKKVLTYYSLPKTSDARTHVIEMALYIPNVMMMPYELKFSTNLFDPLVYLCASQVLTSLEKYDAAKAFDQKFLEMINNK